MKNEQTNNQTGKQGQNVKNDASNQNDKSQQGGNKGSSPSTGKTDQSSSQKSNISVDNEGKIGKAHDQWNNGNQNDKNQQKNDQHQTRSDNTVTEPEIDSPIYDPEKTEKKIPQMENNKNKK
jgi:hypothetical protein